LSALALEVNATDAGISLSTGANAGSDATINLVAAGTLTLDTSANNTNIALQAGTGTLNLSATTAYLTGNLVVTGTETLNGITYTFPGTDTTDGVLTTDGDRYH
jgi:hypothetical protein